MRHVLVALLAVILAAVPSHANDLPRKPMFGVRVAAVPDDVRLRESLGRTEGVLIEAVVPNSTAGVGGLRPGDVIVGVDGRTIDGVDPFLKAIAALALQQRFEVTVVRQGQRETRPFTLAEKPRDRGQNFDVLYGHVVSRGARVRTVVTRPHAAGKHPSVFLIHGVGLNSIDEPLNGPSPYSRILREFAASGYVTLRVEKPGVGDSEGGPASALDFVSELDAYRDALRALRGADFVDADNVFIFGHSMGGVFAPILASESPVRGIAVYGTVVKTWTEYLLENWRRQAALEGAAPAAIDTALRELAPALHYLLVEGKTVDDILQAHPKLRGILRRLAPDNLIVGRALPFWRQLAQENLPAYWAKGNAHVLSMWGKHDFLATEADHPLIADIVNRARPGKGRYLALDGIDHGFRKTTSVEDSHRRWKIRGGEFDPQIVATLKDWTERIRRAE
jgi:pimeloyl-ACP methyl ester carboxylesterase